MISASGTASRRASVGGALALCGALVVFVLSISTAAWAQEEGSQSSPTQGPTPQVASAEITDAAEIARAVRDLDEGRLRFSYATKPGVWGDGHSIISVDDDD